MYNPRGVVEGNGERSERIIVISAILDKVGAEPKGRDELVKRSLYLR